MFTQINEDLELKIGKLDHGRPIHFPNGIYVYVGSAMGSTSTSLSRRLIRHCVRERGDPHPISKDLIKIFEELKFPCNYPASKKNRWHIDFLLENEHISIQEIFFELHNISNEQNWVSFLYENSGCIPVKRFGGSDDMGRAHLFKLNNQTSPSKIISIFS